MAGTDQLLAKALAELDVDSLAKGAGVQDLPRSDSQSPDANEKRFLAYFEDYVGRKRNECERRLADLALERAGASKKLDLEQTKASLASIANALEPDLEKLKQESVPALEQAMSEKARALRYLRYFQVDNDQGQREPTPAPLLVWHFAMVAVFAVIEWLALSYYYAEGSDFGLLGGVLMAMGLSVINITLAVFAGSLLRYVNHKNISRKILALAGAGSLLLLFLLATGWAAHYRTAAREVAVQQDGARERPGAASQNPAALQGKGQVAPPFAAGVAGTQDDEQFRVSKLAWENFRRDGFVFQDVMSWFLVILAIVFGIIAAWKGYTIDDRYPGYGPVHRRYKELEKAYDDAKSRYTQDVDGVFTRAGQEQQRLLAEVRREIDFFASSSMKSKQEVRVLEEVAKNSERTCNTVVSRYRQKNREIATGAAPRYFSDAVVLHSARADLPETVTREDEDRLQEYGHALREYTASVQQYDEKRQALRTQRLAGLTAFFNGLEKAINDKIEREAEQFRS